MNLVTKTVDSPQSTTPALSFSTTTSAAPPAPVAPSTESLADLRRTHSRRYLDQLDPASQTKLLAWLGTDVAIARIAEWCAEPPPRGFGRPVGHTTLFRLRATARAHQLTHRLAEFSDVVEDTSVDASPAALQRSQAVILAILHKTALDLSQTDPASPNFPKLLDVIAKILHLDFRRQSLELQQARFHQSAHTRHHKVDLNILPIAGRLAATAEPPVVSTAPAALPVPSGSVPQT